MSQIIEILNRSKYLVMKRSVNDETRELRQRKGSGRPSKLLSKIVKK